MDSGVEPWPRWVRRLVFAVLGAVIGVGLIVTLSDRGVLPIAGPFVAMLVVPVIVMVRVRVLVSRRDRLKAEMDEMRGGLARSGGAEGSSGAEASGQRDLDRARGEERWEALRSRLAATDRQLARLRWRR